MTNQANIDFFAAIVRLYPDVPSFLDFNAWEAVMDEQFKKRQNKQTTYIGWLNKEGATWFIKEYLGKPEVPKEIKDITANTQILTNANSGMSTGKKVVIGIVALVFVVGVVIAIKSFKNKNIKN